MAHTRAKIENDDDKELDENEFDDVLWDFLFG